MKFCCPNCKKSLNGPAAAIGRKVKCPGCGESFLAQEAATKPDTSKVTVAVEQAISAQAKTNEASFPWKEIAICLVGSALVGGLVFVGLNFAFRSGPKPSTSKMAAESSARAESINETSKTPPAVESDPLEPKLKKLSDQDITALVELIKRKPEAGLAELNTIDPELNSKVSNALSQVIWKRRVDQEALSEVAPNWIKREHLEQMLLRFKGQENILPCLIRCLERFPVPTGVSTAEFALFRKGGEAERSIALFENHYPESAHTCIAKFFKFKQKKGEWRSYKKMHQRIAECLGNVGNYESISMLEQMAEFVREPNNEYSIAAIDKIRERQPNPTPATSEQPANAGNKVAGSIPATVPEPKRPLLCNAPPGLNPFGYEIEFRVAPSNSTQRDGGSLSGYEQLWKGKAAFVADTRQIAHSGKKLPKERTRWCREWFSGLGIPGKQVLSSSLSLTGAEQIYVHSGGTRYKARVKKDLPHGVALLEYEGPDFDKVHAQQTVTFVKYPLVLSRDPFGATERHYPHTNIPREGKPFATLAPRPLPHQASGGIIMLPSGRVGGLVVETTGGHYASFRSSRIVPIGSFFEQLGDDRCFDFITPASTYSFDEAAAAIDSNLVRIEIERKPAPDSTMKIYYGLELNSDSETPDNPDFSKRIFFPKATTAHGSCFLDPLGKMQFDHQSYLKRRSRRVPVVLQLPAMMGDMTLTPFLPLALTDQSSWKSERRFALVSAEDFFNRSEITNDKEWNRLPESAKGIERNNMEVLASDENEATVQRLFSITSFQQRQTNGTTRPKLVVEGFQNIVFDKGRGIIKTANAKGTFEFGDTEPLDFTFELKLLEDEAAAEYYESIQSQYSSSPRKVRDPPSRVDPKIPLTDEIRDNVFKLVDSGKEKQIEEGLTLLATCYPEDDEKVSEFLVENFFAFSKLQAERLFLYWIQPKGLSRVLSKYETLESDQQLDANILDSILNLLELHPPVPEKHRAVVAKILASRSDDPKAIRILARQYPDLTIE